MLGKKVRFPLSLEIGPQLADAAKAVALIVVIGWVAVSLLALMLMRRMGR